MRLCTLGVIVPMLFLWSCVSYKGPQELRLRSKISKPIWSLQAESGLRSLKPLACVYVKTDLVDIQLGLKQSQLEGLTYCKNEIMKEFFGAAERSKSSSEALKDFELDIQKSVSVKDIYFESTSDSFQENVTYKVFILISVSETAYDALKNKAVLLIGRLK